MKNITKITNSKIYQFQITLNSMIKILETKNYKVILKERFYSSFNNEYKTLSFLKKIKFPYVPYFYGTGNINGRKVIIQEFISGKKIEENKNLFYLYFDKIAIAMSRLHSITKKNKKYCIYFLDKEIKEVINLFNEILLSCKKTKNNKLLGYLFRLKKYLVSLPTIRTKYNTYLKYKIKPSLINREPEFIITRKKKIYILDWEYSTFGDYAYDIACIKYIFPNMDLFKFINVYKKYKLISHNLYIRVFIYLFIILLKETMYYISELNCFVLYKKIPYNILTLINNSIINNKFKRIEEIYYKLNSFQIS